MVLKSNFWSSSWVATYTVRQVLLQQHLLELGSYLKWNHTYVLLNVIYENCLTVLLGRTNDRHNKLDEKLKMFSRKYSYFTSCSLYSLPPGKLFIPFRRLLIFYTLPLKKCWVLCYTLHSKIWVECWSVRHHFVFALYLEHFVTDFLQTFHNSWYWGGVDWNCTSVNFVKSAQSYCPLFV